MFLVLPSPGQGESQGGVGKRWRKGGRRQGERGEGNEGKTNSVKRHLPLRASLNIPWVKSRSLREGDVEVRRMKTVPLLLGQEEAKLKEASLSSSSLPGLQTPEVSW